MNLVIYSLKAYYKSATSLNGASLVQKWIERVAFNLSYFAFALLQFIKIVIVKSEFIDSQESLRIQHFIRYLTKF